MVIPSFADSHVACFIIGEVFERDSYLVACENVGFGDGEEGAEDSDVGVEAGGNGALVQEADVVMLGNSISL